MNGSAQQVTGDELIGALVEGAKLMRTELSDGSPVGVIFGGLRVTEDALETAATMVMMRGDAVDDDPRSIALRDCARIVFEVRFRLERGEDPREDATPS